jgi:hypothetical protein
MSLRLHDPEHDAQSRGQPEKLPEFQIPAIHCIRPNDKTQRESHVLRHRDKKPATMLELLPKKASCHKGHGDTDPR